MLSVASLLNPAPSGESCHRLPPSPAASSPTNSFADETAFHDRAVMPKHRMPKDVAVFTKGRAKGLVGFPPHERLDEASLRQVRKYHVFPFGKIQEYCRHIPYNSGKKDFFEKTGRESFEGKRRSPQSSGLLAWQLLTLSQSFNTFSNSLATMPSTLSCGTTTLASSA